MSSVPSRPPDDIDRLFRYTRWAHTRVLDALRSAHSPPTRAVRLFSHILRAQDVWYGRVADTAHATLELWADESLSACADRLESSMRRWQTVLDASAPHDLDQPIAYTNSSGTAFETPLRDIFSHVVNHGTHHRAQIALVLREADIAPPVTDYIFFLREQ